MAGTRPGVTAVAVERGTDATRLVAAGPDGRPEPVAVLPAGTPVATAVDALVGPPAGPVLVVAPAGATVAASAGGGLPAPVAVLAGRPGRFLVVDAGRSGTTLAAVDGGCVRCAVRVPVGGDRLDAVVAAATGCPAGLVRRARETLSTADAVDVPGFGSLEASTVDALARRELDAVLARAPSMAAGVDAVVLAGGLARTPLLAGMLDERVDRPVRVLPEPDLAAVRGGLEILVGSGGVPAVPGRAVAAVRAAPAGRPPRRRRNGRLLPVAAVIGVLLVGSGTALGATAGPAPRPSGTLVQYGYRISLPAGWEHTGGDPQRRRTLLTRTSAPDGVELVSVERSPLGYDAEAEPDRARDELAAAHRAHVGLGGLLADTVAGRAVTRYRQQAGPDAVVDWFVLFDGTDELVVGCRGPSRADDVGPACADVVGSVRAVPG